MKPGAPAFYLVAGELPRRPPPARSLTAAGQHPVAVGPATIGVQGRSRAGRLERPVPKNACAMILVGTAAIGSSRTAMCRSLLGVHFALMTGTARSERASTHHPKQRRPIAWTLAPRDGRPPDTWVAVGMVCRSVRLASRRRGVVAHSAIIDAPKTPCGRRSAPSCLGRWGRGGLVELALACEPERRGSRRGCGWLVQRDDADAGSLVAAGPWPLWAFLTRW